MAINKADKEYIQKLKAKYSLLKKGKESLLKMIDEVEIAEAVYNSNAIENSTLTLKETERILLEMEVEREISLREVFEAKNLARVTEYVRGKSNEKELDEEMILLLHKMLIGTINDEFAGRFRKAGEYVRVTNHIAPAPEHVETLIEAALEAYYSDLDIYFLERIAKFHLEFEHIHPFCDGNGRIGRVIINYQLQKLGFPSIIIRDKEKADYYKALSDYDDRKKTKGMEDICALALMESLHKRLAYLEGQRIIKVSDYAKKQNRSTSAITNAAKRQSLPAFREKGIWKITESC